MRTFKELLQIVERDKDLTQFKSGEWEMLSEHEQNQLNEILFEAYEEEDLLSWFEFR